MLDLIIRGGQVVTSEGVAQRDLGVQGEQIAAVALPGTWRILISDESRKGWCSSRWCDRYYTCLTWCPQCHTRR